MSENKFKGDIFPSFFTILRIEQQKGNRSDKRHRERERKKGTCHTHVGSSDKRKEGVSALQLKTIYDDQIFKFPNTWNSPSIILQKIKCQRVCKGL